MNYARFLCVAAAAVLLSACSGPGEEAAPKAAAEGAGAPGVARADELFGEHAGLDDASPGVYDEILRRFGGEPVSAVPEIRKWVVVALVKKGLALNGQGRNEEAAAVYDDIVKRFKESECAPWSFDHGPPLPAWIAGAMIGKGVALSRLGRDAEALAAYADAIAYLENARVTGIEEAVLTALFNRAQALERLGKADEALAAWGRLAERFDEKQADLYGEAGRARAEALALRALLNEAELAERLNRPAEALARYDEAARRAEEGDAGPSPAEPLARALFGQAAILERQGKAEERLAVLLRIHDSLFTPATLEKHPALRPALARAMLELAAQLEQRGEAENAEMVREQMLSAFSGDQDAEIANVMAAEPLRKLAQALARSRMTRKAMDLISLGSNAALSGNDAAALEIFDDVVRYFGGDDDSPAAAGAAGESLLRKGQILYRQGRFGEAAEAFGAADGFLGRGGPGAAGALFLKGLALEKQPRPDEALAVWEDFARRFGGDAKVIEFVRHDIENFATQLYFRNDEEGHDFIMQTLARRIEAAREAARAPGEPAKTEN
jgi:tetratricopeptide (TPR) repeat protein